MKVVVTGDRYWTDYNAVESVFKLICPSLIIEGEAKGLDIRAKIAALNLHIPFLAFNADWKKYGKAAGPIRNSRMLEENPDICLAFHDNIKNSIGTLDCIKKALKKNLQVILVSHKATNKIILKQIDTNILNDLLNNNA